MRMMKHRSIACAISLAGATPLPRRLSIATAQPVPVIQRKRHAESVGMQARRGRLQRGGICAAGLQVQAPSQPMAPDAAWDLLMEFTKKEAAGLAQPLLATAAARQRLRDALLTAAASPRPAASLNPAASPAPEVLLGVVASDVRLAMRALRDYCEALGLPFQVPESRVSGGEGDWHFCTKVAGMHCLKGG